MKNVYLVFLSCCFPYYSSRFEIKISIFGNISTGGQKLCFKSLGPVLCANAHLGTDTLKRQMRDIALANRSLQHVCPLAREWCFTWKAVSMIWRILDESSCSKPTSAMGKYSLSFYKQTHIINSKSQTKQYNFNKSTITTCTNLVVCVWVVSHGKDGNDVVCGKYTDQCWYRGVILTCIHCVIVIDT